MHVYSLSFLKGKKSFIIIKTENWDLGGKILAEFQKQKKFDLKWKENTK